MAEVDEPTAVTVDAPEEGAHMAHRQWNPILAAGDEQQRKARANLFVIDVDRALFVERDGNLLSGEVSLAATPTSCEPKIIDYPRNR